MTLQEKLAAMELLWADLTRDPDAYESHASHEEELRKTEERVAAGLETPIDSEEAKKELWGSRPRSLQDGGRR
jgi:hypothetical protein